MLTSYAFWMIFGFLLIISEFFFTGLIAIFFGIGAIAVGLLTLLGVIDGAPAQLLLFSLISLAALFGSRKHFKRWLKGNVSGGGDDEMAATHIGARVMVITDFQQGAGHVQLNGAKWDAESTEPLRAGQSAWVVGNRGILLIVASNLPG
ncbi:NfeD family protein [Alcanivorax sp. JB21]|uniref:NfeD family protein n=1 Tax=Alcanivorax limicola TaxID=2874102 RepID=UPI001CBF983E|nr:NfeD family protein [Alcanivorax limicola]MBZ2187747.1 NfeD family protein [Alcanivorax limicola]